MSIVEFFTIFKDIVIAIAAAATGIVAYKGLNKWQKELAGKASFDVSRALIRSVYKLRDEVAACRAPLILAQEFPEDYEIASGRRTGEDEGKAYGYVYSNRWKPVGEALQEFDAASLEAEALWGEDIKNKTDALRKCVRSLRVDIEALISDKFSGGEDFKNKEHAKSIRAGVAESWSKNNELSNKINSAVQALEKEVRPHMARS